MWRVKTEEMNDEPQRKTQEKTEKPRAEIEGKESPTGREVALLDHSFR